jgi:hypothetical protein
LETICTDEAIEKVDSRAQPEKADSARFDSLQPGSNVTVARPHSSKQRAEMTSIDDGLHIEFRDEQEEKAERPSCVIPEPLSNVTVERREHLSKQEFAIFVVDEGIQMDVSDEQEANANSPRVAVSQPLSKLKVESHLQSRKQHLEMTLTDDGIQRDFTEQPANEDLPKTVI